VAAVRWRCPGEDGVRLKADQSECEGRNGSSYSPSATALRPQFARRRSREPAKLANASKDFR